MQQIVSTSVSFSLGCERIEMIMKALDIWYEICISNSNFASFNLVSMSTQKCSSIFKSTMSSTPLSGFSEEEEQEEVLLQFYVSIYKIQASKVS